MSPSYPSKHGHLPRHALDSLLDDASGKPLRHALWLEEMQEKLSHQLPPHLRGQLRLVGTGNGVLSFITYAASWASRARHEQATLLQAARAIGLDVQRVRVKVVIPEPLPIPPAPRPPNATAVAALQHIRRMLQEKT